MTSSCIAAGGDTSRTRVLASIVLLWLVGTALRFTILAVPPMIPRIHADLGLNATQIGMLTGLPSMLLAIAAVPGSLLIARLGVLPAMTIGLVFTAVGGALRGAVADVAWLYAMTIAMGAGVAVLQVCMPPAVRAWTPHRIGFVTAVYTNGLIMGEILPVALSLPLLLPLFGGSWPADFAFWSAPVAVITVLVLLFAPRRSDGVASTATGRRWWPDWGNLLIWRLGLMLGTVNALYFGTNAFLPDYLDSQGKGVWISAALTGLNVGQLPASILLLLFAGRLELKAWPYVVVGALCALATAGIVFGSGPVVVAGASVIGFAAAAVLVLALALPPLLAPPDDVHRVTAAMFTVSYSWAVVVPVISGALWDTTGIPEMTFLPMVGSSIILVLLAPAIKHVRRMEV